MQETNKKRQVNQSQVTVDRSGGKNLNQSTISNTYTRQIVIKTDEPDIPLITILKVEHNVPNQKLEACHGLFRTLNHLFLKRIHHGFSKLIQNVSLEKIYLVQVNRFVNILRYREKNFVNSAWLKVLSIKAKQNQKNNAAKLIFKVSNKFSERTRSHIFDQYRKIANRQRSLTEQKLTKEKRQEFQQVAVGNFSEEFIDSCSAIKIYEQKKYPQKITDNFEPNLKKQLQRFQKMKIKQGNAGKNQLILLIFGNLILTLRDLKAIKEKLASSNLSLSETLEKYKETHQYFIQADKQFKSYLQKNSKRIQVKQIKAIVEKQIKEANESASLDFYSSRVFLLALIAKIIEIQVASKPSSTSVEKAKPNQRENTEKDDIQFIKDLELLIKAANNLGRLQQFKKSRSTFTKTRTETVLCQIAQKFIQMLKIESIPIDEESQLEEETEMMKQEISFIGSEVKRFIQEYERNEKADMVLFINKRKKNSLKEFDEVKNGIKILISIIKKLLVTNKSGKDQQPARDLSLSEKKKKLITRQERSQTVGDETVEIKKVVNSLILIIRTYKDCLSSGQSQRWQKFTQTQIKSHEQKELYKQVDELNDIFYEKITEAENNGNGNSTSSENELKKMRMENQRLKIRIKDLERNEKTLKSRSKEKQIIKEVIKQEKPISEYKQYKQVLNKLKKSDEKLRQIEAENKRFAKLIEERQNSAERQEQIIITETKEYKEILSKFKILEEKVKIVEEEKRKNIKLLDEERRKQSNTPSKDDKKELMELKRSNDRLQREKDELEERIKNLQIQFEHHVANNQVSIQKYKKDIEQYKQESQKATSEIRKYQIELKKLQVTVMQRESKQNNEKPSKTSEKYVSQSQYNEILENNEILKKKMIQITNKMERVIEELHSKENQMENLRISFLESESSQSHMENSRHSAEQSMKRKITFLENTIQSLNLQVLHQKRMIQEMQDLHKYPERKHTKSHDRILQIEQRDSLRLIQQLTSQLQKIKRSEMTLEEINRELENVHSSGKYLQIALNEEKEENEYLRKKVMEKDERIRQLEDEKRELMDEIVMNEKNYSQISTQFRSLEEALAEKEKRKKEHDSLESQQLENKTKYIQKLERIITQNERTIAALEKEIVEEQEKNEEKQKKEIIYEDPETPKFGFNSLMKKSISKLEKKAHQLHSKEEQRVVIEQIESKLRDKEIFIEGYIKSTDEERSRLEEEIQSLIQTNRQQKEIILQYEQKQAQSPPQPQMPVVTTIFSSPATLNNILMLLTNILTNFFCLDEHSAADSMISQNIFGDLIKIKEEFCFSEQAFFINTERYCVEVIRDNIGRYRVELMERVQEMIEMRDRFNQFLNAEINVSRRKAERVFKFDTNGGTQVESQTKIQQSSFMSEVEKIKEQTLLSQNLFQSRRQ